MSSLYTDFPPGLDTPFNHMVAYLLRITTPLGPEDYTYIRSISKTFHSFIDLPIDDMRDVIELSIKYGYFDGVYSRKVSLNNYFESMDIDRLEKLKSAIHRLIAGYEDGDNE